MAELVSIDVYFAQFIHHSSVEAMRISVAYCASTCPRENSLTPIVMKKLPSTKTALTTSYAKF